jgi:hypothetical protein
MRKAAAASIVLLAAVVLWLGLRPGTPARTYDAYERKAKDTAESVLSSVETARLVARLATDGDAFGPYVSVTLSESETAVGDATASFAGLQPPDARADRLRSRLLRSPIARATSFRTCASTPGGGSSTDSRAPRARWPTCPRAWSASSRGIMGEPGR